MKGAAVGAVVELRKQSGLDVLRQALGQEVLKVQRLSPPELRIIFDSFDTDADGVIHHDELTSWVRKMGVSAATAESLFEAMDEGDDNVTFEMFSTWWERNIIKAPVTLITSADEWKDIVDTVEDHLVLLEVGFTFCRPCRAFEPKYEKLALKYPDVRCVRVNGNENRSTISLCRDELKVERTPTFFFFKNGVQVHSFIGTDAEKLEALMVEYST